MTNEIKVLALFFLTNILHSFQSQRMVMPKNVQTTTQLHSFYMMYSAYKLNNQGENIQLCPIPFPV